MAPSTSPGLLHLTLRHCHSPSPQDCSATRTQADSQPDLRGGLMQAGMETLVLSNSELPLLLHTGDHSGTPCQRA